MSYEYPTHPVMGVGAVIVHDDKVLIVKRGHEPRRGEWSLPGGRVELGETMVDALRREIAEETGLVVKVGPLVELCDRIHVDGDRIRYHFVIADYLCEVSDGTLRAGDDAEDVAWVSEAELVEYGVNKVAVAVVCKGLAMVHARAEARALTELGAS